MLPKSAESAELSQKFYCVFCDYYTSHKSHFEKHLRTQKHVKNASPNVTKMLPKSAKKCRKVPKIFVCNTAVKNIRAEMVYGSIKKMSKEHRKRH